MVLTRCKHCGAEADTDVVSITHKSTCHSAGKDGDNEIIGTVKTAPKAIPATETSPKKSTSTTGGKKSRK